MAIVTAKHHITKLDNAERATICISAKINQLPVVIKFIAIKTSWGWQACASDMSDTGINADNVETLADKLKSALVAK